MCPSVAARFSPSLSLRVAHAKIRPVQSLNSPSEKIGGIELNQYKLRICDRREEDRPRNRLINNGPASLSNHELLSIIIRSGSVQENALSLAQRIFSTYDLLQLSAINIKQLTAITGIKESKAAQIAAFFELARRLENFTRDSKIKINSPEDVWVSECDGLSARFTPFTIAPIHLNNFNIITQNT